MCEPDTLCVSSFTQTPPRAENPSWSQSSSFRANGVATNPSPSTSAIARSSRLTSSQNSSSPCRPQRQRGRHGAGAGSGETGSAECPPGTARCTGRGSRAGRGRCRRRRRHSRIGTDTARRRVRFARNPRRPGDWRRGQRLQPPVRGVELVDQRVPPGTARAAASRSLVPPRLEVVERHALLLDPREVAEVEDALALLRRSARGGGRWPRRASARRRSRRRRPRRSRRRSRARRPARARCRTCAAPSVATVRITSSGPSSQCFASLIAARTLQMLDRPSDGSAARTRLRARRRVRR